MKSITVLISACGSLALGPSLVKIIRTLSGDGFDVKIIGLDTSAENACKELVGVFYTSPAGGTDQFVNFVKDVCCKEKVDVILGTSVEKVIIPLLKRKKEFEELNVEIPSSSLASTLRANNKIEMLRHLDSLDIPKAKYFVPKNVNDLIKFACALGYPDKKITVKPSSLSGSRGFKILSRASRRDYSDVLKKPFFDYYMDLDEYCDIIRHESEFPDILMMEYLPGADFSVYVYAENGKALSVVPIERIKFNPGVSISNKVVLERQLIEIAKKVTSHFDLDWNVNIQLKMDENNIPKVYEINPRIAGSIILTGITGTNFLKYGLLKPLGHKCTTPLAEPKGVVVMHRYLNEVLTHEDIGRDII